MKPYGKELRLTEEQVAPSVGVETDRGARTLLQGATSVCGLQLLTLTEEHASARSVRPHTLVA